MLRKANGIMTETDKKILELMGKNLLMTKLELMNALKTKDGSNDVSLQRLREFGYVEAVESMGNCYVVTQQGMRALKK
ncbi:MAG: hypothetical protein KKA90_02985 [Nanoarchaeota archaeon]|nr:hypothetical protein [Nanoarchaeota archaeon]